MLLHILFVVSTLTAMNFTPSFRRDVTPDSKIKTATAHDSVRHYMATDLITFHPDQEVSEAIATMLTHKISGAPVLDEHRQLVGILSEKDCLRLLVDHAYYNQPISKGKVGDYMSREVMTVSVSSSLVDVANAFARTPYRRFPVVENGKVVGQVSRRDVLRAIKDIEVTTW